MIEGINNEQDIFNFVATHLMAQGAKSMYPDGLLCGYRGMNNRKCAAGCLIEDKHYSRRFEGKGVSTPMVWGAIEESIGRKIDRSDIPAGEEPKSFSELSLIRDLQKIHDGVYLGGWKTALVRLAASYSLQLPECLK